MKLKRSLQIVILVSMVTILVFGVALAGTTQTMGKINNISYKAKVKVDELSGIWTQATAETVSSLPAPSVVGWYWFQSRELCGDAVVWYADHGGAQDTSYPYTYKSASYGHEIHVTCPPGVVHKLSAYAKFDFKSGSDVKSPIIEQRCEDVLC
jgi:hypothetical protein